MRIFRQRCTSCRSRFTSRGPTHAASSSSLLALAYSLFLAQLFRSNATSSINILKLSIIMSPAKQSLSLQIVSSSSCFRRFRGLVILRPRSRLLYPRLSSCLKRERESLLFPLTVYLLPARDNIDTIGYSLSTVESDITYAQPKPRSLVPSYIPLPLPRRFLLYISPSFHDVISCFENLRSFLSQHLRSKNIWIYINERNSFY